ncbi:MAG: extracellular solute-binding protein [Spirochaetaceae bacterium]|nr:MAG: extracellular solute-binding protein [Spirochaetaceae bacterium]
MRKFTLAIVFVCVVMLLAAPLFGGGGKEAAAPDGPVTIQWWTHQRHDLSYVEMMMEEFNRRRDDINVVLTSYTTGIDEALNLAFEAGTAPDTVSILPDARAYIDMGRVLPIEDYLPADFMAKFQDYRIPNVNTFDGKFYTLPNVGHNFRFVYNREFFEEAGLDPDRPPRTFDEVIEYAEILTEHGRSYSPRKYGFMLPIVETWIWYQYADQIGAVSGNWHFDYEELEFQYINHKPILEFYMTLRDRGVAFPGGLSLENDPARAQFSEGNVGMMLAASWDIGVFNDQFPANHEWGVAHLPTPDGQRRGKGQMGGGGSFWLTSVAEFPEVAAEWLAFMVDDEYLIGYYERGLGLPVRPEIAQQADTPDAYGFPGFADTENDDFYPATPPGLELEGPDRGVVYNQIMAGQVGIEEGLRDLDRRMNNALQEALDRDAFDPEDFLIPGWDPMNPNVR